MTTAEEARLRARISRLTRVLEDIEDFQASIARLREIEEDDRHDADLVVKSEKFASGP
ncbi:MULTISPECIES: hypothetical protein [Bradyrhizobium]|uniref:hypothetical protein n=1 Tax=Bradyrhizobium elkanii TaxID=29448 RepID=UPI00041969BD|nr:hypothetical protein [Bradyrhizobium elkanii]